MAKLNKLVNGGAKLTLKDELALKELLRKQQEKK
jgi:hypothetical protein